MTHTVFTFSGLPGAGKSTAAKAAHSVAERGGYVETGELVRQMAADDGLEDPSSHELGEWAAAERERSGGGFIGEKFVGMCSRGDYEPSYPLFVDGVRHRHTVKEFREYFEQVVVVLLKAGFANRLDRLQGRGRDGEDEFTEVDLLRRDGRELKELGLSTILQHGECVDHLVCNNAGSDNLEAAMVGIVADYIND